VPRELVDRTGWMVMGHNRYWSANTDYAITERRQAPVLRHLQGVLQKGGREKSEAVDDPKKFSVVFFVCFRF
jgi:hypothetical protein